MFLYIVANINICIFFPLSVILVDYCQFDGSCSARGQVYIYNNCECYCLLSRMLFFFDLLSLLLKKYSVSNFVQTEHTILT